MSNNVCASIVRNLEMLSNIKEDIRQSIIGKGVSVGENTPFGNYAGLINDINDKELLEQLNRELQGKLGIINALNMKFGLGLSSDSDWDVIIQRVKEITVSTLFSSTYVKQKMVLDGFNMKTNIKFKRENVADLKEQFKTVCKIELKDFNMEVR